MNALQSQVAQLKGEVNRLASRLGEVRITAAPARRRRRRKAPVQTVPNPPQPRARRRRNRRAGPNRNLVDGEMRLSKSEILASLVAGPDGQVKGNVKIVPSSIALLNSVYTAFERLKWLSIRIYWKPAVGTTEGGLVTYGIDWDFQQNDPKDRAKVAAYTPSHTNAIWCDSTSQPMVLPSSRIQARLWYTPLSGDDVDKGPGALVYFAQGPANKSLGEFWIDYVVVLSGTRP